MRISALLCFLTLVTGYSAAQDTNFASGPQYLLTGSPLLARPLATPSMSLDAPLPPVPPSITTSPEPEAGVASTASPVAGRQADLITVYYGPSNHYQVPGGSVLELSAPEGSGESLAELPAGLFASGVSGITDVQTLQMRGYGITLGEAAKYWKAHKVPARRIFSNKDITRLHQAS
jgi:hypothetical protein